MSSRDKCGKATIFCLHKSLEGRCSINDSTQCATLPAIINFAFSGKNNGIKQNSFLRLSIFGLWELLIKEKVTSLLNASKSSGLIFFYVLILAQFVFNK